MPFHFKYIHNFRHLSLVLNAIGWQFPQMLVFIRLQFRTFAVYKLLQFCMMTEESTHLKLPF